MTENCNTPFPRLILRGINMLYAYLLHDISVYRLKGILCLFNQNWERQTRLKLITLYLPETYIKALDQLVDERFYPNRAEAIRVAIRDLISAEVWRRKGVD